MDQILRNSALDRKLIERGYVQTPLLSPTEVSHLLEGIARLRPADGFDPSGKDGIRSSTYHCTFIDTNVDYKRAATQLITDTFARHVEELLQNYRILNCSFYVKPPGKGEFEIHQNWPATDRMSETTLTIWCPLVDVDLENGTLQVVEGSHKIVPDIACATAPPFFSGFTDALLEKYLKPIPLKAGEALIFDDSLIHYSTANNSTTARFAIQILVIPKQSQPCLYYLNPQRPELGFEKIAVDSQFFIEHTLKDVLTRPPHCASLGFIENPNSALTEEEFAAKLKQGAEIRHKVYAEGSW